MYFLEFVGLGEYFFRFLWRYRTPAYLCLARGWVRKYTLLSKQLFKCRIWMASKNELFFTFSCKIIRNSLGHFLYFILALAILSLLLLGISSDQGCICLSFSYHWYNYCNHHFTRTSSSGSQSVLCTTATSSAFDDFINNYSPDMGSAHLFLQTSW